ncbi:MAG: hypothetical protein EOO38_16620, partial [Cytophagaceae bacterium]
MPTAFITADPIVAVSSLLSQATQLPGDIQTSIQPAISSLISEINDAASTGVVNSTLVSGLSSILADATSVAADAVATPAITADPVQIISSLLGEATQLPGDIQSSIQPALSSLFSQINDATPTGVDTTLINAVSSIVADATSAAGDALPTAAVSVDPLAQVSSLLSQATQLPGDIQTSIQPEISSLISQVNDAAPTGIDTTLVNAISSILADATSAAGGTQLPGDIQTSAQPVIASLISQVSDAAATGVIEPSLIQAVSSVLADATNAAGAASSFVSTPSLTADPLEAISSLLSEASGLPSNAQVSLQPVLSGLFSQATGVGAPLTGAPLVPAVSSILADATSAVNTIGNAVVVPTFPTGVQPGISSLLADPAASVVQPALSSLLSQVSEIGASATAIQPDVSSLLSGVSGTLPIETGLIDPAVSSLLGQVSDIGASATGLQPTLTSLAAQITDLPQSLQPVLSSIISDVGGVGASVGADVSLGAAITATGIEGQLSSLLSRVSDIGASATGLQPT